MVKEQEVCFAMRAGAAVCLYGLASMRICAERRWCGLNVVHCGWEHAVIRYRGYMLERAIGDTIEI